MNTPIAHSSLANAAPEFKQFKIIPVSPALGGVIEGMHLSELTEESSAELRTALWHYGVLFAREQHLNFDQQKAVALCFADELEQHTFGRTMKHEGHPEVVLIQKYGGTGKNVTSTDIWHHDVSGRKHPNVVGVIQADEVPFGADTMWASMTAAYERLPFALKLLFLNIDVDHDLLYGMMRHDFGGARTNWETVAAIGEAHTHPAVINHPVTGKLSLFVGNGFAKRVNGYSADFSELIFRIANELPRTPEIQVRHQWKKGDVAIWDNFGTTHYGVAGDLGDQFRRLFRVATWSKNVQPTLDRERAMRELLASQAAATTA